MIKSTVELVLQFRAAHGGSANKAAPHAGVSAPVFADWCNGKELPSELRVVAMSRALGEDEAYALAILRRDRAPELLKPIWQRIAEGLAVMVLAATPFLLPSPAQAAFNNNPISSLSEYTLRAKRRRSRRRSAFAAAVAALLQLTGCTTLDEPREALLTLDACYLQDASFFSRQFTAPMIFISPFNDSIRSRQ